MKCLWPLNAGRVERLLQSDQNPQEVGGCRIGRGIVGDDDSFRAVAVVGHGLGGECGAGIPNSRGQVSSNLRRITQVGRAG